MTRKHFEFLAELIAKIDDAKSRRDAMEWAIEKCRRDNCRFDAIRFAARVNQLVGE